MTTVYIAGPMRGYPEFNFPAFDSATIKYRALGYEVISPAQHDREEGLDVTGCAGTESLADQGFDLREALMWDLTQVIHADRIVMLKGWEQSSGARAEYATAIALGKTIIIDEED